MKASSQKRVLRRPFVSSLIDQLPNALIVSGLGSSSYDVYARGDRNLNFYLWGAMGGAAPFGFGLALAQPEREVVVITGDGEQMMGLGALASIGVKKQNNLTIIVLDNGYFGETGMQPSHSGLGVDFVEISKGCGIKNSFTVDSMNQMQMIVESIKNRSQPTFVRVLIEPTIDPKENALPPRDGSHIKNRFRAELELKPF